MAFSLYKTKIAQILLEIRRRKRAHFVLSKVNTFKGMSILDVGCGQNGRSFEDFVSEDYSILGIDIVDENTINMKHPRFKYLKQSAHDLSNFADDNFDLAVSFGMMEHICDFNILKQISSEIIRVSKQLAIVVPWKYALIEPHFKFPLFQFLPYPIKVSLTKLLNLHNLRDSVRKDYYYIEKHYQWLTSRQWMDIFEGLNCYVTPHMDTIVIIKHK